MFLGYFSNSRMQKSQPIMAANQHLLQNLYLCPIYRLLMCEILSFRKTYQGTEIFLFQLVYYDIHITKTQSYRSNRSL